MIMTTSPDAFLTALGELIESRGYHGVKTEATFGYKAFSRDAVTWAYTDLLDERHYGYVSREDGEPLEDFFERVDAKVATIPLANDALRADAAAMVQRVRGKLIDAGFEEERWMAELTAIVADLSGNALTKG